MKKLVLLLTLCLPGFASLAQGVLIGDTAQAPHPSAILELRSNQKGFMISRLTTTQRNAIVSPPQGLQIFNTTTVCLEVYFNAIGWKAVACACTVAPPAPQAINGPVAACLNQQGVTYSIAPVVGAASYAWTVPNGATIVTGQGTTSITVNFGSSSGNVSVSSVNSCGNSAATNLAVTVANPNPSFTYAPGTISIGSNITFTPLATGVTYQWTFPGGNPATSTAQNPVVQWANTGNYTVKLKVIANGNCMDSSTQNITVINCPPGSQTFNANGTNATGSIQTFTVPNCVSQITIDARGAQGGGNTGANGARMIGTFAVTPGSQLKVLVGQRPACCTYSSGGGGGGGSFVTLANNTPLIVAGGGGGSSLNGDVVGAGGPGLTTTAGGTNCGISGGTGGSGGGYISNSGGGGCGDGGSGGGGLTGNGTAAGGGQAFVNGGLGGTAMNSPQQCVAPNVGGFGGGGTGGNGGGGGGGYSGGAGGNNYASPCNSQYTGGMGGGSYNNGTNQTATQGFQAGNGQIIISW